MDGQAPAPDSAPAPVQEPSLAVRTPRARSLRRRALRVLPLVVVMALTVAGTVQLARSGNLLLPMEGVTPLRGRLASIGDFFEDPQVIRILRKHDLKVEITTAGSREVATGSLKGLDFVFPSGKPAADQVNALRQAAGEYSKDSHPFDSPLVLATFRPYARALEERHVATPQPTADGGPPLYYTVDTEKFLELTRQGLTWDDLDIQRQGIDNHNRVLAQTSDICQSNSADSYLGLAAFTLNGNAPATDSASARSLAREMSALLLGQGSASDNLYTYYVDAHGISQDPVAVLYEHQFLAYQSAYRAAHGRVDSHRVLLYPRYPMLSQPHFVALDHQADQLGRLLESDPELRRRETELGYQLVPSGSTDELAAFLHTRHVPAPHPPEREQTGAKMPDLDILEDMIADIKECPEPVRNGTGPQAAPRTGR